MKTDQQRAWARLGAAQRLLQLDQERAAILKVFPGLTPAAIVGTSRTIKPPRRFSAAAKRRMSAGMRKYWARRKAHSKAPQKSE